MRKSYTLLGNIVFPDRLEAGCVCVEAGRIIYAGDPSRAPDTQQTIDTHGGYIAPGFIDIHCHAGGDWWAHEDPEKMALHHLKHGTTGLLCTLYRDVSHKRILETAATVQSLMAKGSTILGLHLEGPYLNPKYGSGSTGCAEETVDAEKYLPLADTGIVKQWTFAPEVKGAEAFVKDIVSRGIVPAIGHSAASPEEISAAEKNGARIVTHLFDATGSSIDPPRYGGTIEVSFNFGALVCDKFYYEIICDQNGVHVRPELVKLALKTVGVDRIIGVTDACTGDTEDNADVNFVKGELMGSKLTMDCVARNFHALGLTICEVFRVTSLNPAKILGMDGEIGSIEVGKKADLLVLNEKLNLKRVYRE